jgi:hypothetical protein
LSYRNVWEGRQGDSTVRVEQSEHGLGLRHAVLVNDQLVATASGISLFKRVSAELAGTFGSESRPRHVHVHVASRRRWWRDGRSHTPDAVRP